VQVWTDPFDTTVPLQHRFTLAPAVNVRVLGMDASEDMLFCACTGRASPLLSLDGDGC
jgi:hypothetical protein